MKSLKILFILSLFVLFIQTAAALTITIPDTNGEVGKKAEVSVMIEDASNVGSIDLTILYDPSILEISKVEKGNLVKGMFSSNTENDGIIVIELADSNGINGDGEIAKLTFNVLGNGSTPITIQNAKAYDVESHGDIEVTVENGNFQASPASSTNQGGGGTPGFEIQTVIIIFMIAIFIFKLRRKERGI